MFFHLAKALQFFLRPSNAIILLSIVGCLMLASGHLLPGGVLLMLGIGMAAIIGWTPLSFWLLRPLEETYPPLDRAALSPQTIGGIILLGGGVNASRGDQPNGPIFTNAGSRLITVLELAQLCPRATILLSGGSPDILKSGTFSEAGLTRDLLIRLGVTADRLMLEERSRDTFENARESGKLFANPEEKWLLVTSAAHMPRAMASFGKRAAQLIPCCADYKTQGSADNNRFFGSAAHAWLCADIAAHEWLGLIAYRLTGRISQLPGLRRHH